MKQKQIKKRNLQLHLILVSKTSSGSSGRHATKSSKHKAKKITNKLIKEGYYD